MRRDAELARDRAACTAPLPPYAISERSRGSAPWPASTLRVAFAMLAFTMRSMPHAASVTSMPSGSATCCAIAVARRGDVEVHAAAREPVDGEVAEHGVGVGDASGASPPRP